jgi:NADH dehydrogenase FAD-containing subunit
VTGGGFGGITAALRLSDLFRGLEEDRVVLLEKNPFHALKT